MGPTGPARRSTLVAFAVLALGTAAVSATGSPFAKGIGVAKGKGKRKGIGLSKGCRTAVEPD